ncbi:MAG: 2-hydroxyacyl-CoA dehydratase family protein [Actinobacteria bacterium]|nr:2-hydroxyacyl-CoA dehydratase family protein [Actinomycetota bacterium]
MTAISRALDTLRLAAANGSGPRVGWFCIHAPLELVLAAGLRATRVRGLPQRTPRADGYLSQDACPYLRCSLESGLSGRSQIDGIIGVPCCDGLKRHYELWCAASHPSFSLLFDMPKIGTFAAKHYLVQKLHVAKQAIEKAYGVRITKKALHKAVRDLNRLRARLRRLDDLRALSPGIIGNGDFHELVLLSMESPVDVSTEVISSTQKMLKRRQGKPNTSRLVPLAVGGNIIDGRSLFDTADSMNGVVVADDLCTGNRFYALNTVCDDDLLDALAERSLQTPPCSRMVRETSRFPSFAREAQERGARGVIFATQPYCDASLLEYSDISHEAEQLGLPTLLIELDESPTGGEIAREKIKQFMELIT